MTSLAPYMPRCVHDKPIIGRLIASNGHIQIRAQCAICCSRGNAIPHRLFAADVIEQMTILNEPEIAGDNWEPLA